MGFLICAAGQQHSTLLIGYMINSTSAFFLAANSAEWARAGLMRWRQYSGTHSRTTK
jgi:hypothetical protein